MNRELLPLLTFPYICNANQRHFILLIDFPKYYLKNVTAVENDMTHMIKHIMANKYRSLECIIRFKFSLKEDGSEMIQNFDFFKNNTSHYCYYEVEHYAIKPNCGE